MPQLICKATDAKTGQAIPSAEITAQYNTSPCAWDDWGCSTGDGQSIQGYTDGTGTYKWSIPYSCAGSFTNIVCQANGYAAQTLGNLTFGPSPGNQYANFEMTPNSVSPPPGQGASSWLTSIEAALGYSSGQTASSWLGVASSASWMLVAILVIVAIIIIALVLLLGARRAGPSVSVGA